MGNVEVIVAVAVASFVIYRWVRNNRAALVGKRGLSIAADLGSLADKPRVRVQEVTDQGQDRVHVTLAPFDQTAPADQSLASGPPATLELGFTVELRTDEFGFGILQGWLRTGEPLGVVMPEGSSIVRLRSIGDLQPITLKRVPDE